jgi:hypothetical protein
MPRFRLSRMLLVSMLGLGLATSAAVAKGDKKRPAKTAKVKKAPPKKVVPVSADHKKKLAELYGGFKFGMSKDDVIGVFAKQLEERYAEKLKSTTDVAAQDRLRKDRKTEIARLKASYVTFEKNKPSPWDVSIVEEELAHDTGESMLERWENQGGKNQRRFFFFYQGKLWKMFISLDVSILPEDKKNFDTFQGVMQGQYGPGNIEPGLITWSTGEFDVRAVDKLRSYDALALVIEDPSVRKDVLAMREAHAPPKKETSSIIKAVIDPDQTDHPDVKAGGSSAVDAVIKAQGGGGTKRK